MTAYQLVGTDDVAGLVAAGRDLARGPDSPERQRLDGVFCAVLGVGSYLTLRGAAL